MNLNDGTTLAMELIKRAKYRINKRIKLTRDTEQCVREIAINNGWIIHIFHILREKRDENFLFKRNLIS